MDEIMSDHNKVSGDMEPEKKRNDSDMEIIKYDIKNIEEDLNIKYDVWSDSRDH